MIKLKLSDIAEYIDGRLVFSDAEVSNVFTDSRQSKKDALFVALKGDNFDAHLFLNDVVKQGAKGLVVEQESAIEIPQIVVDDTRLALGKIAKFNRIHLTPKTIAITGSSGKTTVKEMTATILKRLGKTIATYGNLNNDIGAPLTLLKLDKSHEFAVVELGANHAGEIKYTSNLTLPDVAMVNNVGAAHLEGFGSLQGVANAKGEIYQSLSDSGVAVVNLDEPYSKQWLKTITSQVKTFSKNKSADVTAKNIVMDKNQVASFDCCYKGQVQPIKLAIAGEHNVSNALAAATCCLSIGVELSDIAKGLSQAPVVSGRLNTTILDNGCRIIDDSYNANLSSMKAAIKLLSGYDGKRIFVAGDMAELGEYAQSCHQQIGEYATQKGIDAVYACGKMTQHTIEKFSGDGNHSSSQQDLIKQLKQQLKSNTSILIKGSRSAQMEKVVKALLNASLCGVEENDPTVRNN